MHSGIRIIEYQSISRLNDYFNGKWLFQWKIIIMIK